MTEDFLGAGIHQQIIELGSKEALTVADVRRLAQMGIDPSEVPLLAKEFQEYGLQGVFEMSPWARQKLQDAITLGVEETLIQGDSIHVPNWLKVPNQAVTLLGQFQRFPILAHNVYLRKGLTDEQARTFGSVLTATVMYAAYRYLREQATISAGFMHPNDAKYDIFDPVNGDDNLARAIIIGSSYAPNLGMFIQAGITTAKFMGMDFPGNDYNGRIMVQDWGGPSASMIQDIFDMTRAATDDTYLTDERMYLKAQSAFMPHIPLLYEGVQDYIKQHN
jgi:hypothetical protein